LGSCLSEGKKADNVLKVSPEGGGAKDYPRYHNVITGLNDTKETLLASLERNKSEILPSTFYGLTCVQENVPFINDNPQNTFVPDSINLAIAKNNIIVGDDEIRAYRKSSGLIR